MRILVAEDDFASRRMMQKLLEPWGRADVAVDGQEAVDAFELAWAEHAPYELIFMDIMMPKVDGQEALRIIRESESRRGVPPAREVRVIMTSVLEDPRNVMDAFGKGGATAYLVKPISREKLETELERIGFPPAAKRS
ncbi:MAG: response regulator [Spirochaetales bacterium]|nr:response regulator [Spirochaetales bacterium]